MSPSASQVVVAEHTTQSSFEAFFRANYLRLAQACFLLTGDRHEAQDAAQESLARVYARWGRIRSMRSPEGYLYKTALNVVRKKKRRPSHDGYLDRIDQADPAIEVAERDRIMRALASLPKRQRETLVLVEWIELGTAEAGRALGITESSVRVNLHRARATLREELGEPDD
jgi:RNA polymerase sigma factor (sigma-70 family)